GRVRVGGRLRERSLAYRVARNGLGAWKYTPLLRRSFIDDQRHGERISQQADHDRVRTSGICGRINLQLGRQPERFYEHRGTGSSVRALIKAARSSKDRARTSTRPFFVQVGS